MITTCGRVSRTYAFIWNEIRLCQMHVFGGVRVVLQLCGEDNCQSFCCEFGMRETSKRLHVTMVLNHRERLYVSPRIVAGKCFER